MTSSSNRSRLRAGRWDQEAMLALANDEDKMMAIIAIIGILYATILKSPAPFMTFVLVGMESVGKSTIFERCLNAAINITTFGTGSRCPLDVTCVHDDSLQEPIAFLAGDELDLGDTATEGKEGLKPEEVCVLVNKHMNKLKENDAFSNKPLTLVLKSPNVSNMKFLDTAGFQKNADRGNDNREAISEMVTTAMNRPHTELCVFLQAEAYRTNPIINVLDEAFGTSTNDRGKWADRATFVMTKFDKLHSTLVSKSSTNEFVDEFYNHGFDPYFIVSPVLKRSNYNDADLYSKKTENLVKADKEEEKYMTKWLKGLDEDDDDEVPLNEKITERLGFQQALSAMRLKLVEHTLGVLPSVFDHLESEIRKNKKKLEKYLAMKKAEKPKNLVPVVQEMCFSLTESIKKYIGGDASIGARFPENGKTLEQEIQSERISYWCQEQILNAHQQQVNEEKWRELVEEKAPTISMDLPSKESLLGGAQIRRAVDFFFNLNVECIPEKKDLPENLVNNGTGYCSGDTMRPNVDRAVLSLVKWLVDDHVRPGVNYVVKHIGDIFVGMFQVALKDIQHGRAEFQHVPVDAKKYLMDQFSKMLWKLIQEAAASLHNYLDMASAVIYPQLVSRQDELSNEADSSFDVTKAKERLRKTVGHQASLGLDGVSHTQEAVRDKALQYLFELLHMMVIPLGQHLLSFVKKVTEEMTRSFNHTAANTNWDEVVTPNLVNDQRIEDLTRTIAELESTMKQVEDTVEEAIHSAAAAADVDSVTAASVYGDLESTMLSVQGSSVVP